MNEYFEKRSYCGKCGRKSYGKLVDIDFFYDKGRLELCTLINKPTNKFKKLGNYFYGIISFHNEKRITTFQKECDHKKSLLCLRFWKHDYPYLNGNENHSQRWLPIPENSEVQRIIRNHHQFFPFK